MIVNTYGSQARHFTHLNSHNNKTRLPGFFSSITFVLFSFLFYSFVLYSVAPDRQTPVKEALVKVAVLSDIHFSNDRQAQVGNRLAGFGDVFLLRAVHRLNRYLHPDLVVLLGDVINDGTLPTAGTDLERLKTILDLLHCPRIVLPGNHDGDPDLFYSVFDRPEPMTDIGHVRFLPFVDPEEPGYNARREPADLQRMQQARYDWKGPVIALQHVPVFPPGAHSCPYNYVNAEAICEQMEAHGITAAIAGHYHAGFDNVHTDHFTSITAPALCEAPFQFLMLDIDEKGSVSVERHSLAMPKDLHLTDVHVHTHLAYCNENMDVATALALGSAMGLAGIRITEHSGHLYFSRSGYGQCARNGMASALPGDCRMDEYIAALDAGECPVDWRGIEIDCGFDGQPLIRPDDLKHLPFRVGAMHQLAALQGSSPDSRGTADEFLRVLEIFLKSGIRVLAHPFRVFRRSGRPTPPGLFAPTVDLLRHAGVAAEINFHTNDPDPRFVRMCIDAGVPLVFGSDSHNLYEVGEFYPHLELLRQAGYNGDVRDILLAGC